jgi:hypothetical protein
VLLVPGDLFWYRIHPGQEIQNPVAAREYALVPGEAWRALGAPSCPLNSAEREQARKNLAYTVAKQTLHDVRAGRWAVARRRLRHAGISAREWLRYARPARRSASAGTPIDRYGEYMTSPWSSSTLSSGPGGGGRP